MCSVSKLLYNNVSCIVTRLKTDVWPLRVGLTSIIAEIIQAEWIFMKGIQVSQVSSLRVRLSQSLQPLAVIPLLRKCLFVNGGDTPAVWHLDPPAGARVRTSPRCACICILSVWMRTFLLYNYCICINCTKSWKRAVESRVLVRVLCARALFIYWTI